MSIVKPYTFVPGTKARANEVNEDFDRLYEQVNTNITNIAENASDITNLGIDKADVQGNSTQRFAVADATSSYDAINKQTAMKYISNSVDIIGGLVITKDSGSPEDTIIVDVGACYDSEREVVMQLTASTSKKNYDQLGNANYYVYIISDDTGNNPDVLISASSITPGLPAGYTRYRKIGYFETDGNNKISNIYSFGVDPENPSSIKSSYINGDNGYVVFSNGFKIQWGRMNGFGSDTWQTVYFLVPYTISYSVSGSTSNRQSAGDKRDSWAVRDLYLQSFVIRSNFENNSGQSIWWMTVGF